MSVFLKKVTWFGIAFLSINIFFLILVATTDSSFQKRIESLNFDKPKHDLLIFGNSLAMDGVDCEFLNSKGFDCYNMAIGGSSIKTSTFQLQEYIANYKRKPDIIIMGLGTYMSSFDDSGIHPVVEFTGRQFKFSLAELPIVKFKWLGTELLKKIVSKHHRQASLKYGQLRFAKTVRDNTIFRDSLRFPVEKYTQSVELRKFIDLCVKENINLILIEMPGFRNTRNQDEIGPFYPFDNLRIPVFNFNNISYTSYLDDDKDWIGNSHLNEKGAIKFTHKLYFKLNEFRFLLGATNTILNN